MGTTPTGVRVERWWRGPLVAVAAGTAVTVLTGLVAADGVPGWEEDLFHAVNDLPDALRAPMWVFQLAGLLLVPIVVAAAAAATRRFRLALALVAVVPLKLLVERGVVKQLVERERPGTSVCDGDAGCANFRDAELHGLSFVSGHAVIAWGVAALLVPHLPRRWRWVPVAVAVLNSVARIYLGAHNPLDVVGGAGVGVALGAGLSLLVGLPREHPGVAR